MFLIILYFSWTLAGVWHSKLYSISTWGLIHFFFVSFVVILGKQCSDPYSHGVAMKVSYFMDFITENVADGEFCQVK